MTLTFSAITPSYNQRQFLPACIESVHGQTLLPVEHIVVDPGSTDGSVDYATEDSRLTPVIGKDSSQSDAVNLGVCLASGDIIAWLNSDDCYVDETVFERVAVAFEADPSLDVVYGRGDYIDEYGAFLRSFYVNDNPSTLPEKISTEVGIAQPSAFFRSSLFTRLGGLDEQLTYSMDYDLWIRAVLAGAKFRYLDARLAKTRVHGETKTFGSRDDSFKEVAENVTSHFGYLAKPWADRWAKATVTATDGIIEDVEYGSLGEEVRAKVDRTSLRILRSFNHGPLARNALTQAAADPKGLSARQTIDFLNSSDDADEGPIAFQPLLVEAEPTAAARISRPVNSVSHDFDERAVEQHLRRSDALLAKIRERGSERAVILGNGPSLRAVEKSDLEGSLVFGSNYVFLNRDLWPEVDVLAISNPLVAAQRPGAINMIDDVIVAFPWWLCAFLKPKENTLLLRADGEMAFSTHVTQRVSWCHTVTYLSMQLAYSLGCTEVVLAGFDHYYTQSESLVEGDTIEQDGDDQNHFDPSYFGNKRWHAADVDGMESVYLLAKSAYEADGRVIRNGTRGGHLDVFDRVDFGGSERLQ